MWNGTILFCGGEKRYLWRGGTGGRDNAVKLLSIFNTTLCQPAKFLNHKMQKHTPFLEIMVELAPLNAGPSGPVTNYKKGTLFRALLYAHDNTKGAK